MPKAIAGVYARRLVDSAEIVTHVVQGKGATNKAFLGIDVLA
jgi:hypothetical protein